MTALKPIQALGGNIEESAREVGFLQNRFALNSPLPIEDEFEDAASSRQHSRQ